MYFVRTMPSILVHIDLIVMMKKKNGQGKRSAFKFLKDCKWTVNRNKKIKTKSPIYTRFEPAVNRPTVHQNHLGSFRIAFWNTFLQ